MKFLATALLSAFVLSGCTFSYQPSAQADLPKTTAGTVSQQAEATKAARDYLSLIDDKRFEATWDRAGSALKASTSRLMWISTLKLTHGTFGISTGRVVEGVAFSTQVDANVPVGDYALVQFKSRSGGATVTEKIVMQKENGAWKIIGFFVTKNVR